MRRPIVETDCGVTVIGAGETPGSVLVQALINAPILVAADGGARRALELGYMPTAVIGDLDSLDSSTASAFPGERVHRISEQETTDFDKCLRSIRAPLILAVGFTGARLDHELAAFSALVTHARRPIVMLGPEDVAFVAPREFSLALDPGTRLSLFPLAPVKGTSRGLRWPIEGLRFAPGRRIGTSNQAVARQVALTFTNRRMLVLLPRHCLAAAIRAVAPVFAARSAVRDG